MTVYLLRITESTETLYAQGEKSYETVRQGLPSNIGSQRRFLGKQD